MIVPLVYLLSLAGGAAVGLSRLCRGRGRDPLERFRAATTPLVAGLFAWGLVREVVIAPSWEWNNVRLAPAFALARGLEIYSRPGRGAALSTMYGPISAVAYLPATLASSPTVALLVGCGLSLGYYFLPVVALYAIASRRGRSPSPSWGEASATEPGDGSTASFLYAFAVFGIVSLDLPSLNYSAGRVHADAPALGLAMAACGALLAGRDGASAALAWLSVLTKQTMLPIVAVLPIWVLLTAGRRAFGRYLLRLALAGGLLLAATLAWFDARALAFNVLTVPGRYPWKGRFPTNLMHAELGLLRECLIFLVALIAGAVPRRSRGDGGGGPPRRRRLAENPWCLLGIVGVAMIPVSVLGFVKEGGVENCYSPTTYFLAAAFVLMAAQLLRPDRRVGPPRRGVRRLLETLTIAGVSVYLVIVVQAVTIHVIGLRLVRPRVNRPQVASDYLRRHPGAAYFPGQPLAHLMAEGRLYHFLGALHERRAAGIPVGEGLARAHVPPGFETVCYSTATTETYGDELRREFLRDYSVAVAIPELPGFACYRKPEPTPGPSRPRPPPSEQLRDGGESRRHRSITRSTSPG
ncbi:MAG TPA: hypothetical protein VF590_16735 [Isosphaeraceae bacterium]